MAEIDMPVQEEVTRLSSTLQAEKERELANISKTALTLARTGQNWPAFDSKVPNWLASGSIFVRTEANVVVWCTKTFCKGEDAIKQIRKSQGISKQTWLIGVDIDDNGLDSGLALPGGMKERVEERQENHKLQLEKAMEPSYQCNFILAGVCCLFKEKLRIEQDNNFIMHVPADAADVHAYKYKDGPDPDTDNITFDLTQNYSSPWNSFLLSFLLHKFQMCCVQEAWPIRKDDDYIEEENGPQLHHCDKSEAANDDLCSWKWLQHLINTLGDHEWQKNIDQELEIIDLQQVLNKDIFCSQGRKPLPRKHAPDNPASSWAPVMALPMTLHDDRWILQLTEHQRESLKILKESFPWMKIVATLSWCRLYNFVGWERCSNDQGDSWAMIG
ncbi:hypothetical protein EDD16DRAFT_1522329 [Pisolithus croceorrhizus]|nr:hypothetical protein EDD16DRAFT_1522329 [Pisolithus croceorrhizus]KAI6119709.1 hypothetical protein EV401DRAFT_1888084 [Pisolithus croceorrhizus]KAI6156342.1 hypothetical protein EDD17DRAFT_1512523 [Pisolithus thermaeus]